MNYKKEIKTPLEQALQYKNLEKQDVRSVLSAFFDDKIADEHMKDFLVALYKKGETAEELSGAIEAIKQRAKLINTDYDLFDCCGTGGDGMHSYNISTTVAFILSAAGIKIAKHGNRASTSKCGSADVLEALNVNINADETLQQKSLEQTNICFLLAPLYHSSLVKAAPIRKSLEHRTIFNLIGPMANPAQAKNQIIGVFDEKWLHPLCDALIDLGHKKIAIVHSHDGFDEISIFAPTSCVYYDGKAKHLITIHPEDFGIKDHDPDTIKGGDANYNANAFYDLLKGERVDELSAYSDMVCLNAAFPLFMMGLAETTKDGFDLAKQILSSGKALEHFERFREALNS